MALRREQLTDALTRGHRKRADWRLGLEYEQFVTDEAGRPVPYGGPRGVEAILKRLADRTGWKPAGENGRVLALKSADGRALTLEPGAQLEFNSSPCRTVGEIDAQVREYFGWLREIRDEFGVYFLALGAHPTAAPDEIERIPKARYDIMEPHLRAAGHLGVWMMKATAGIQVNFDHESAADAARKLRVAFALAPVFTALFANSPLRAGEASGYATWRGHVWTDTDPERCGIVEACTRPDSTLEDFVEWGLAAHMLFIERDGALVDMRAVTFGEYLDRGHQGHVATAADWDLHLSTLFPEVRLRPQLELRSLDTQCPDWTLALCALVKGLFYDEGALQAAWELTSAWSHAERLEALHAAHRQGLAAAAPGGGTLLELARQLVGFAKLPAEEQRYLEPLHAALEEGRSNGEVLAARFEECWQGDVHALIQAVRCLPGDSPVT